jgi:hypothetical protein
MGCNASKRRRRRRRRRKSACIVLMQVCIMTARRPVNAQFFVAIVKAATCFG